MSMINFSEIEKNLDQLSNEFHSSRPFEYVVIDNFLDENKAKQFVDAIPDPVIYNTGKSRDYIFAKNKYEKSNFKHISTDSNELYCDLISDRFERILQQITDENIFVDKEFHGGGIHQGGAGSFLDMHADFNFHPLHDDWFRNINILIYLNNDWKKNYGGELKLRHLKTNESAEVEPVFNRCVIMFTRGHTLHGYDKINFPENMYRTSIAAYGYSIKMRKENSRSTVWYPSNGGKLKSIIGRCWPILVKVKNKLFGSATMKNK